MKCSRCSAEIEDGGKYCPECGLKVEEKRAEPNKARKPEKKKPDIKIIITAVAAAAVIVSAVLAVIILGDSHEKQLKDKLSQLTEKPIVEFSYDDFNADGEDEAFAVVGTGTKTGFVSAELWFVSDNSGVKIKENVSGTMNGIIKAKEKKYISVEIDGSDNKGHCSYIYGVEAKDKYYEPEISGKYQNVHQDGGEVINIRGEKVEFTDENSSIKIPYAGPAEAILHADGVDYCPVYNGKFCAVTSEGAVTLSEQNCEGSLVIINDVIYYTVVDSKEKFRSEYDRDSEAFHSILHCSIWKMNLDGSGKEELFKCSGSGCVVYADNKNVYYTDDDISVLKKATEHYVKGFYKYNLETKTSKKVLDDIFNSGYDNFRYLKGYLFCQRVKWDGGEVEICRYDMKTDELQDIASATGYGITDNGTIFYGKSKMDSSYKVISGELISYDIETGKSEVLKSTQDYIYVKETKGDTVIFSQGDFYEEGSQCFTYSESDGIKSLQKYEEDYSRFDYSCFDGDGYIYHADMDSFDNDNNLLTVTITAEKNGSKINVLSKTVDILYTFLNNGKYAMVFYKVGDPYVINGYSNYLIIDIPPIK